MWGRADKGPAADSASFVPLFDGKSFAGWEGNMKALRHPRRGNRRRPTRQASAAKRVPLHENALPGFRASAEVPASGRGTSTEACSFVASGSRERRNGRLPGRHGNLCGGACVWGCLYDEQRHKPLVVLSREEQSKLVHRDNWNNYVILAEGQTSGCGSTGTEPSIIRFPTRRSLRMASLACKSMLIRPARCGTRIS